MLGFTGIAHAQDTTWTILPLPFDNGYLTDIHFVDKNTGWAVGNKGMGEASQPVIIHTANEGETWIEQNSGVEQGAFAVGLLNYKEGIPGAFKANVEPPEVTLNVNEQQQFHAKGYDVQGNKVPITPEWTATGGTITTGGLYTATEEGDFTVTASVEDSTVTGTGAVHVTLPGTPVETATGSGTAYFATDAGTLENLAAADGSTLPAEGKPALVFPHGFFSFNITGLTPCTHQKVVVTITLPSAVPVGTQYWKYHASEGGWIQIPMGSDDGDLVITITLEDGGLGDDDGECNGVIVDQGGPGNPAPVPVPAFSPVGLLVLIGILNAVLAAMVLRKKE